MKVKDYFLTQEVFDLIPIEVEGVLKTYPVPENISPYYNSDKYISHHQDSNSLKERIYKLFQNYNLKYKKKLLDTYVPKKSTVLDYGCGAGEFLKFIEKDYHTLGYEPNSTAKENAVKKNSSTEFIESIDDLSVINAITLWHVLEHIENQEDILNKFHNLLVDNGMLIIALPNHASYDARHYKEFWAAYDVPRHLHHYSRKGFLNFVDNKKWKVEEVAPLYFDSFYISIISEQYKKNPLFWLSGTLHGAISNFKALFNGEFSSLIYILRKI